MTIISTLSFSFILKVLFQTSFLPKRKTQSTKNYVYIVTKPIPLQTLRQFKLMGRGVGGINELGLQVAKLALNWKVPRQFFEAS